MIESRKKLKDIYTLLLKEKIIDKVVDLTNKFYDEPKLFHYICVNKPNFFQKYDNLFTGISLESREQALLKCLVETVERTSVHFFREENIIYDLPQNIKKKTPCFIDPNDYLLLKQGRDDKKLEDLVFGWVRGYCLTKNSYGYIPVQLVYPDYKVIKTKKIKEPRLLTKFQVVNGVAGGLTHRFTLLRAIYEIIERDAYTTLYITKTTPRKVDIRKIRNKSINKIIQIIDQYNLILYVFDITNDLEIPVFMSFLIDPTGVGSFINLGFRAGLDTEKTILGSIEDSLLSRKTNRTEVVKKNRSLLINFNKATIKKNQFVGSFWMIRGTFRSISYLFNRITNETIEINRSEKKNLEEELTIVTNKLKNCGYNIWLKNVTLGIFKKLDIIVYKTVIPGLQPPLRFSFNKEKSEVVFPSRIKKALSFYKKKGYVILRQSEANNFM